VSGTVVKLPFEGIFSMLKNKSEENSERIFENKIDETLNGGNFWSVKDVARYTGYAVGSLYNLVSEDVIPFRKKRGKLYFVPYEIHNWIHEGDL